MAMIHCSCKDPNCHKTLQVETEIDSIMISMEGFHTGSTMMYVDPNTVLKLIRELQMAIVKLMAAKLEA